MNIIGVLLFHAVCCVSWTHESFRACVFRHIYLFPKRCVTLPLKASGISANSACVCMYVYVSRCFAPARHTNHCTHCAAAPSVSTLLLSHPPATAFELSSAVGNQVRCVNYSTSNGAIVRLGAHEPKQMHQPTELLPQARSQSPAVGQQARHVHHDGHKARPSACMPGSCTPCC